MLNFQLLHDSYGDCEYLGKAVVFYVLCIQPVVVMLRNVESALYKFHAQYDIMRYNKLKNKWIIGTDQSRYCVITVFQRCSRFKFIECVDC